MAPILLALPLFAALLFLVLNKQKHIYAVNVICSLLVAASGLLTAGQVFSQGPVQALGQFIYIDALGALIIGLISVIGLLASLYSVGYTAHEIKSGEVPASRLKWYYFWFYIFIFTMLVVVTANNLGIMWVAIEGTTLASALLVGYYDKHSSLEAAWKYIIICTVGIIFALFGIILLYVSAVPAVGSGALDWNKLIQVAGGLDPKLLKLAFVFILVGYGTKAGFAPMHTWLPDAHSQAPSPVSAVLSGVLLNCALYGILRVHLVVDKALATDFSANLLLIFGLLSVGISLPFIIVQHDIKRLLAYSSIEHMGIVAAAIGLGGKLGLYGAFLHMINHALAKSTLFFAAGNITQQYRTKKIARIKGVVKALRVSGPALFVGALAIAGVPPFNIFLSEFTILSSGFAQGKYAAAGILLLLVTMVFAGIVFSMSKMALGSPPGRVKTAEPSKLSAAVLLIPLSAVVVLGIYIPSFIDNILGQVVEVMGGGH